MEQLLKDKEKRFRLKYDANIDQGIFKLDELVEKLSNDGYFNKDFWTYYSSEKELRESLEKFEIGQHQNIAYEALWNIKRII